MRPRVVGYIRQSRRGDLDVALSYDVQLGAIHRMAERDGIDPDSIEILADMGRSGGAGKESRRLAYQELLRGIHEGSISTVYALSMSRLARSVKELLAVYERAAERGIRIVYEKEGEARFDTPDGRMRATILAAVYEFERDLAVERALDNARIRRARGERMGRVAYGERPGDAPQAVEAAFREAGSLNAAARVLNARGLPSPMGRQWSGTAVRLVLARIAPHLLPRRPKQGAKPSSPFLFYRLLRCHCGRLLTASRDMRGNREVVYRCHAADTEPDHARPYRVRESQVYDWIVAEAAHFGIPADMAQLAESSATERADLQAQRDRVLDTFIAGHLTADERDTRLSAIAERLDRLAESELIVGASEFAIDWRNPPETINRALRSMWTHVELGLDMRPVRAEWRDLDFRRD